MWLNTCGLRGAFSLTRGGATYHGRRKEIEYATELEKSNGNAASREGVVSSDSLEHDGMLQPFHKYSQMFFASLGFIKPEVCFACFHSFSITSPPHGQDWKKAKRRLHSDF